MCLSLQLNTLYNHKVFASAERALEPNQGVSFFGGNRFFDVNTMEKQAKIHGVSFDLSKISNLPYDNIECMGQNIAVKAGEIFTHIHLVGFSDRGSFFDECVLEYENGERERVYIDFDDWARNSFEKYLYNLNFSLANKIRIFAGFDSKGDRIALTYCDSVLKNKIAPISQIFLPDNPLIHICFIALSKA